MNATTEAIVVLKEELFQIKSKFAQRVVNFERRMDKLIEDTKVSK